MSRAVISSTFSVGQVVRATLPFGMEQRYAHGGSCTDMANADIFEEAELDVTDLCMASCAD